jgi:pimeloyl-ACP methyl ester carboxylesterase
MPMIDINGTRLRVEVLPYRRAAARGDATPIVCVHGLAASAAFWYAAGAQVMAGLGPCTLYDLRGHGKSDMPEAGYSVTQMADDLLAIMGRQGIAKAHLVAHSFGGMIALLAALRAPDRVASLVLADVRVRPLQQKLDLPTKALPPAARRKLAELGMDVEKISQMDDGVDYLRTVARVQLAAGAQADALLSTIYQHPGLFRSRRNAQKWVTLAERASFVAETTDTPGFTREDLRALSVPMLILVGEKSTTLPSAKALAELCPWAILNEIPNAGHFFPMSKPRQFLGPTLKFLRAVNNGNPAVTLF